MVQPSILVTIKRCLTAALILPRGMSTDSRHFLFFSLISFIDTLLVLLELEQCRPVLLLNKIKHLTPLSVKPLKMVKDTSVICR